MAAPRDLVDAVECVVSVFFSSVRHRVRAAFLLADELVEMTCKARARQAHPNLGRPNFFTLLSMPAVGLDPGVAGSLGETLNRNHETRNGMQHGNAAFTVDEQHCADAILDAVKCMEHCIPGCSLVFPEPLRVALRVVGLLSSGGDARKRVEFEEAMRRARWRGVRIRARGHEMVVAIGTPAYWGSVMLSEYPIVEKILTEIRAP